MTRQLFEPPTERRAKPRIYVPFAAKVKGRDSDGRIFRTETSIDSLSVSGLYLRLTEKPVIGSYLLVAIRLSAQGSVAVRGKVLRCELERDGSWGVALALTHYRLF
jgi:hypothetical protein